MPVAEANPICHTRTLKLTICPKQTGQDRLRICRTRDVKVEECRRVMEPVKPIKDLELDQFLVKRKGQQLLDVEVMEVDTQTFARIEKDQNFVIDKNIKLDELSKPERVERTRDANNIRQQAK